MSEGTFHQQGAAEAGTVGDGDPEPQGGGVGFGPGRRMPPPDHLLGPGDVHGVEGQGARLAAGEPGSVLGTPQQEQRAPSERAGRLRRRHRPELGRVVRGRERPGDLAQRLGVARPPLGRLHRDAQPSTERPHHERHEEEGGHGQEIPRLRREPESGGDEEVRMARGGEQRARQRGPEPEARAHEEDRHQVEDHDALPEAQADRQRPHPRRDRDRRARHGIRADDGDLHGRRSSGSGGSPPGPLDDRAGGRQRRVRIRAPGRQGPARSGRPRNDGGPPKEPAVGERPSRPPRGGTRVRGTGARARG